MRPNMTLAELRALPADERFEVLCDLWDEIVVDGWRPTVTPELSAELARRWAAYRANPSSGSTWKQVKAQIRRPTQP